MLNKQVGAELGMAEKTVKLHRGRIMHKIGVVSVAELVRVAANAGVTLPKPASSMAMRPQG
jgi:FixJ family two-component response regulator